MQKDNKKFLLVNTLGVHFFMNKRIPLRATALAALLACQPAFAADVVISQMYGAGGNNGATLRYDYVGRSSMRPPAARAGAGRNCRPAPASMRANTSWSNWPATIPPSAPTWPLTSSATASI
jgi:hypothetical protein